MKIVLTAITLSVATLSGASALNFSSVDDVRGQDSATFASKAGDGFVSMHEANEAGISALQFKAADADGNGKLTPTEFKNV